MTLGGVGGVEGVGDAVAVEPISDLLGPGRPPLTDDPDSGDRRRLRSPPPVERVGDCAWNASSGGRRASRRRRRRDRDSSTRRRCRRRVGVAVQQQRPAGPWVQLPGALEHSWPSTATTGPARWPAGRTGTAATRSSSWPRRSTGRSHLVVVAVAARRQLLLDRAVGVHDEDDGRWGCIARVTARPIVVEVHDGDRARRQLDARRTIEPCSRSRACTAAHPDDEQVGSGGGSEVPPPARRDRRASARRCRKLGGRSPWSRSSSSTLAVAGAESGTTARGRLPGVDDVEGNTSRATPRVPPIASRDTTVAIRRRRRRRGRRRSGAVDIGHDDPARHALGASPADGSDGKPRILVPTTVADDEQLRRGRRIEERRRGVVHPQRPLDGLGAGRRRVTSSTCVEQ